MAASVLDGLRPYQPEDLDRVLRFVGECCAASDFCGCLHPGDVSHFMSNMLRGTGSRQASARLRSEWSYSGDHPAVSGALQRLRCGDRSRAARRRSGTPPAGMGGFSGVGAVASGRRREILSQRGDGLRSLRGSDALLQPWLSRRRPNRR